MAEMTIEQQRALAVARARRRAAEQKEPPRVEPKGSRTEAVMSGFMQGFEDVGHFFNKTIATLVDKFDITPSEAVSWAAKNLSGYSDADAAKIARNLKSLTSFKDVVEAGQGRRNLAREPERLAHPNYFVGGRIGGQAIATAPFISATGAGIAKIPGLSRVGGAVASGGLGTGRTAAETAALARSARLAQLGERMVGGGIAGAEGALLTNQDVGVGAAFGAGLPVVAKIVRVLGGKGIDLIRAAAGGAGMITAGKLIREALGKNVEKARALFAQLSPDDQRLAARTLVEAGIDARPFIALAEDVTQLRPNERAAAEAADLAQITGRLEPFAGGTTATQTRRAAEEGRKAVSAALEPQRTGALANVNAVNQTFTAAENLVPLISQRADEMTASGFVQRMRDLEERAAGQAELMGDNPALFPDMTLLQGTRGVSGAAGGRADAAMAEQIALRDRANAIENAAADLAAQGVQPLRAAPIVQFIRDMAREAETRASKLQAGALTKLARHIEGLADANGMLDARDLYQVRKSELNDVVDVLLGSRAQPASGVKEAASSKMMRVRDMFDDMIEKAGGVGWKDYLARARTGYEAVNRQELAGHALMLARKRPDDFIDLMGGNRDDIVESIMGRGVNKYDIDLLAQEAPDLYDALKKSSAGLEVIKNTKIMAGEGNKAALDILGSERPTVLRNLTRMSLAAIPHARIAAEAGEQAMASSIYPRVKNVLAEGLLTPGGTRRLMDYYPTSYNADAFISSVPAPVRNAIVQAARGKLMSQPPPEFPTVDENGAPLVGIGEVNGQRYPMYGLAR